MSWIPIPELPRADLPWSRRAELIARAMTELAAAQALVLVHGPERGMEKYLAAGGSVRQDEHGNPVIWAGP